MKNNTNHNRGDKCPVTIKTIADEFVAQLPQPVKTRRRPGSYAQNAKWALNMIFNRLDPDTPAIDVFRDPSGLRKAYEAVILNEAELAPSSLRFVTFWLNRFMKDSHIRYGFPPVPSFPLPAPNRVRTACPGPVVIAKTMAAIVVMCPEILAFVILLAFYGLRGEEAYFVLANLRTHLAAPWLSIPSHSTRDGRVRLIRHRAVAKAWTEFLLARTDPAKTDFRPRDKNGAVMPLPVALMCLYRMLRDQNPKMGKMPSQGLRKCWLSACIACEVPRQEIMEEVGPIDSRTLQHHYSEWSRAMGESYWAIRPPQDPEEPKE